MKIHWRVHRSRAVVQYLSGLGDDGKGIRQILALLAIHGVPATAQREEEAFYWEAAGHWIVCIVAEEERAIFVSSVLPVES